MGYTTEFEGSVRVEPPLNVHEVQFLKDFAESRRMDREEGPYYARPGENFGQDRTPGIRNYNAPPKGQPGLWCQWEPDAGGTLIAWNGMEKFYDSAQWMQYLIDHFLKPGAEASRDLVGSVRQHPALAHFTFDHTVSGAIDAQGEDPDDAWRLVVEDNVVYVEKATRTYGGRRRV